MKNLQNWTSSKFWTGKILLENNYSTKIYSLETDQHTASFIFKPLNRPLFSTQALWENFFLNTVSVGPIYAIRIMNIFVSKWPRANDIGDMCGILINPISKQLFNDT